MKPGKPLAIVQAYGSWIFTGLVPALSYSVEWAPGDCRKIYRATRNARRPLNKHVINPCAAVEEIFYAAR